MGQKIQYSERGSLRQLQENLATIAAPAQTPPPHWQNGHRETTKMQHPLLTMRDVAHVKGVRRVMLATELLRRQDIFFHLVTRWFTKDKDVLKFEFCGLLEGPDAQPLRAGHRKTDLMVPLFPAVSMPCSTTRSACLPSA